MSRRIFIQSIRVLWEDWKSRLRRTTLLIYVTLATGRKITVNVFLMHILKFTVLCCTWLNKCDISFTIFCHSFCKYTKSILCFAVFVCLIRKCCCRWFDDLESQEFRWQWIVQEGSEYPDAFLWTVTQITEPRIILG